MMNFTKRILSAFICLLLCLSLAACKNSAESALSDTGSKIESEISKAQASSHDESRASASPSHSPSPSPEASADLSGAGEDGAVSEEPQTESDGSFADDEAGSAESE